MVQDRRKAQGGARASSSGRNIAKSGAAVAGPGLSWPPDPTKGPCRWKTSRVVIEAPTVTRRREGRPWRLAHPRYATLSRRRGARVNTDAKAAGTRGPGERRQRCQRLDRIVHRGKTTPTPVNGRREAEVPGYTCSMTIRRSGLGRCETSGPPVKSRESPDSARHPRGESRGSEAGNTRGAGARKSYEWQTSVGRIARLLRREVARPRGARGR
jgi:hypothetical protein